MHDVAGGGRAVARSAFQKHDECKSCACTSVPGRDQKRTKQQIQRRSIHRAKSRGVVMSTNQATGGYRGGGERRKPLSGNTPHKADTTGYGPGTRPESANTIGKLYLQFMLGSPRVFKGGVDNTLVCSRPANDRVQQDGAGPRRASDQAKTQNDNTSTSNTKRAPARARQSPRAVSVSNTSVHATQAESDATNRQKHNPAVISDTAGNRLPR